MTPPTSGGDFSTQAPAYARSRPGYPPAILTGIASCAALPARSRVCEIGAGTGAFTRILADAGHAVIALEPGQAMRSRAPALDGVTWRDGTFEQTGLETASVDWVVAAQAFHWADPPRALPEIHRVLKPAGHLTVLWNERENDREENLTRAWAFVQQRVPGFEDVYKQIDWEHVLTSTGHFELVACHAARQTVPMDRERFLDLWRSHLRLAQAAGEEGVAWIVRAVEEDLREREVEDVAVPYLCRGWTARACAGR